MLTRFFVVLSSLSVSQFAFAQDARDEEFFGASADPTPAPQAAEVPETSTIGGRLEINTSLTKLEDSNVGEAVVSRNVLGDFYFDTRPDENFRGLLRLRFSESNRAAGNFQTDLDEAWFRTNTANTVFYTIGKQHIRWGTGRIWNPTDFLATVARDPFASFDRRLGYNMIKVHVPIESKGFNYYFLAQLEDATSLQNTKFAIRSEHVVGTSETALSIAMRKKGERQVGVDFSAGVGPFDLMGEAAWTDNSQQNFYRGQLDVAGGTFPQAYSRKDDLLVQWTLGANTTVKYSDEDSFTVGAEYFRNNPGYTDRDVGLYAWLSGASQALYVGRDYAALYFQFMQPGSWNSTNLMFTGIRNLSDTSTRAQALMSWEVFSRAQLELSYNHCFGNNGDLCFALPGSLKTLLNDPSIPPELRTLAFALPSERPQATVGLGLSTAF